MSRVTTELALQNWRDGSTQAERLCASILHLEGFEDIDPQAPLGGPDDRRDIICERAGRKYLAAVYFPGGPQPYSAVRRKFKHDLAGVARANVHGILFMTNQHLTPSERGELEGIASFGGSVTIIYHLERLRAVLDSPRAYGIRLTFLGIPMTTEEQVSFFGDLRNGALSRLLEQSKTLKVLVDEVAELRSSYAILADAVQKPTPPPRGRASAPAHLTAEGILMLHRGICSQIGAVIGAGELRSATVWVGSPASDPTDATYVAPSPESVPVLLEELLDEWNDQANKLRVAPRREKLRAIARFHHRFLAIHPFNDANGAVVRELTKQQAKDLLGIAEFELGNRENYYGALRDADAGDMTKLYNLFEAAFAR